LILQGITLDLYSLQITMTRIDQIERCFICGVKMTRGNAPALAADEQLGKLAAVSRTVARHASAIVGDILARVLSEAMDGGESVCRLCFNLLDDVDYHLKEAQEKTDEITSRFLEKGKDPARFSPQPVELTTVAISEPDVIVPHSPAAAEHPSQERSAVQPEPLTRREGDADTGKTEDEMSVNAIGKNKAKLLSHVLMRKGRHQERKTKKRKKAREVQTIDGSADEDAHLEAPAVPPKLVRQPSPEPVVTREMPKPSRATDGALETVDVNQLGNLLAEERSPRDEFQAYEVKPKVQPETARKKDEDSGPVKCELCGKKFKRTTNLHLHMEKVHIPHDSLVIAEADADAMIIPETHKCDLCPREFTSALALASHKEKHASEPPPPAVDDVNKRPKTQTEPEGAEVKATCPQCGKHFRRHSNMRTHVDRVHNKVKPFPCRYCDKAFATNSDLRQHLAVHGEGKMFKCDQCEREFASRDSFILHKKQHSGTRTHFCPICPKSFYKASCLTRHMRSHTGARPYKCADCGKGFSQSTSLKTHVDLGRCANKTGHHRPATTSSSGRTRGRVDYDEIDSGDASSE